MKLSHLVIFSIAIVGLVVSSLLLDIIPVNLLIPIIVIPLIGYGGYKFLNKANFFSKSFFGSNKMNYPEGVTAISKINKKLKDTPFLYHFDEQDGGEKLHYRCKWHKIDGDLHFFTGYVGEGYKENGKEKHYIAVLWDWTYDFLFSYDSERYTATNRLDPFATLDRLLKIEGTGAYGGGSKNQNIIKISSGASNAEAQQEAYEREVNQ